MMKFAKGASDAADKIAENHTLLKVVRECMIPNEAVALPTAGQTVALLDGVLREVDYVGYNRAPIDEDGSARFPEAQSDFSLGVVILAIMEPDGKTVSHAMFIDWHDHEIRKNDNLVAVLA